MGQILGSTRGKSSAHIDQLKESQLQSSIFRLNEDLPTSVDFQKLQTMLKGESHIPGEVADQALLHIQDNLAALGLDKPEPALIMPWLRSLLREQGYNLGELSIQSLEMSLSDVELNIYHPVGFGAGADQNPEATSRKIAQRIKAQFACRRVFQDEVVQAHDEGLIEVLHMGSVDRPHDVFLTPDYLKLAGPPIGIGAPSAGPARRPDVLLSHLIRFTHELRNHFAGDIQWGYFNTLLLPFLAELPEVELQQFVQQILFEFAQLDVERGGMNRKVSLDFDFEVPKHLANVPAIGPGGRKQDKTYGAYHKTLAMFNEIALDILNRGDFRGNPFHSPRIIYHLNDEKTTWTPRHHLLLKTAFRYGNPCLAFSYRHRMMGALGRVALNNADFLKQIQNPALLRGFSSSSLAVNLPRLVLESDGADLEVKLDQVFDLAVTVHRQKRLFISRLMAYGNRGPLQFLRHKINGSPFLKIDQATQPIHLIGLSEAAALRNGSPSSRPAVIADEAQRLVRSVSAAISLRNQMHKLKMNLCGTRNESVAYRFAFLDLRKFGKTHGPYFLHSQEQPHPIYSEGSNILAFQPMGWRERLRLEGGLQDAFTGPNITALFLKNGIPDNPALYQQIFHEAAQNGVNILQPAPDLEICMSCFTVFNEQGDKGICPSCESTLVSPYGLCQSNFSPVHSWCLGKRSEWKIRHRIDEFAIQVQTSFEF